MSCFPAAISASTSRAELLDYADADAQRVADIRWAYDRTTWRPVSTHLPRARLVTAAQYTCAVREDLAQIDVETTALVDRPLDLPSGAPGSARIVTDRPGHIEIETTAATRQLLVLSESSCGWQAEIDGRPPVLRVYGDFMGCMMGPGRQHLVLRFRPASYRRGLIVSLAALALAICSLFSRYCLHGLQSFAVRRR